MVHGKRREFAIGLLLSIITGGIYSMVWHYLAFKELYDREKRDDFPATLFICGILPIVSLVAMPMFMAKNLDFLNDIRSRNNLEPIFGIGGFLAWYILGSFIVVGPFVAYYKLQNAINDVWDLDAKKSPQAMAIAA